MGLTPKREQEEPLKTEEDLDRYLQYAFTHQHPGATSNTVTVESKLYNLSADEIFKLGKEAGYSVEFNDYDPSVVNFS